MPGKTHTHKNINNKKVCGLALLNSYDICYKIFHTQLVKWYVRGRWGDVGILIHCGFFIMNVLNNILE